MAYNQPVRFLYQGDKRVALRFVREARRQIANMLARLPTTTPAGRRVFDYPDNVTIEIVIADRQVTAIIRAGAGKMKVPRVFDDFVVTPRSASWPDGTDPEFPQMILRAPIEGTGWRTFFYDGANPIYPDFDRPKGTYRRDGAGQPLFPEGIVHAGNVDWRATTGERISWYGPDSRYFYDTYRQPKAQYGRFVFNLGQILLDVDQYCLDNDENWECRLVVGACLREHEDETWLYVMMADMPDVVTPTYTVPAFTVYFSENYPQYDVPYRLRRLRLTKDASTTEAMKWSVVDGSAEQLWTASAYRGCNPWVFSTDGTKMTTFTLSDSPSFYFSDSASTVVAQPPPTYNDQIVVDLTNPNAPTFVNTEVSIPPGIGAGTMAVDYTDEGEVIPITLSREPWEASPHALVLRMGDVGYPVWFKGTPAAGFTSRTVRRYLLWMDAREQFAVFEEYILNMTATTYAVELATVIYHQGVEVARRVNFTESGGATTDNTIGALEALKDAAVAPLAWMWAMFGNAFGTTVRAVLAGLTASQTKQPFVPAETFGQFGARANAPGPSTSVAGLAAAGFSNNPADVHDHRVSSSGAARKGTLVYSGWYDKGGTATPSDQSISYVTGESLAALTGVSDTNARYHPVWLLGQPIGGEDPVVATP